MLRLDLRTSFRISLLVLPILVSLTSWSRLVESGSGPVAVDDSFQVHGATYLDSLLANDSDPDGRFAFFFDSFVSLPQHGTLGGVSYPTAPLYSPDQGYLGTDSWVYRICDSESLCATATVTVNVVNNAPAAVDDSFTVHGATYLDSVLANDYDPDHDAILFDSLVSLPQHGTLGGVGYPTAPLYNPDHGYVGTDSYTYRMCDSLALCATATVTLNVVNNAPVAVDDSFTVHGATYLDSVLANDYDPDHDAILFDSFVSLPQHGILAGVGYPTAPLYVPDSGYSGTDSYSYRICDVLGLCAVGNVYLQINGDATPTPTPSPTPTPTPTPPSNLNLGDSCPNVGGPVNVTNGNMYLRQADYQLSGVGESISFARTYNSMASRAGLFGRNWSTGYDEALAISSATRLQLLMPDGKGTDFNGNGSGSFTPVQTDFFGHIDQNSDGTFSLSFKDGRRHVFSSSGALLSLRDLNGNQTTLTYDVGGKLTAVIGSFGWTVSVLTNTNGQVVSLSDSLGTIATYAYGSNQELLSVTYADNSAFHFSYDGSLRLTAVTDALGNIVESHAYDGQGRAITSEKQGGVDHYSLSYVSSTETDVTDALGRVTKYTFDTSKSRNVVTRVEGLCSCGGGGSQTQTMTYDDQLNVTSRTDALSHVTSYTYDANGNRLTETDPTGTVTYTYNGFAEVLTRADQLGGVTTSTYDASGNLLSVKDALNNTTTAFTYDARGELLTMTNALGRVTTLAYYANGNISQTTDALGSITKFSYDARGRMTTATDALNNVTTYGYDAFGRLIKITRPDSAFVMFTYDLAGRRTKFTDALNHSTSFGYDGAYQLITVTDASSNSVTYGYDLMSNLTSATDQLGRTTNYSYDDFNRLTTVSYPPAATGAPRLQKSNGYDAVGNVTQRTDTAGRATNFAYDSANRLTSVTDPLSQVTRYEYNSRSNLTALVDAIGQRYTFDYDALGRVTVTTRAGSPMSFAYDAVGNRIRRTDYNNALTAYTYDALNRLTKITYPDTSALSYSYDRMSRLTAATNVNGTVSFVYDSLGRATSTTDVWGQTINYSYDANSNRTQMNFGATLNAAYSYDTLNRLTAIADGSGLAVNYAYDAASKLISRILPNDVVTTYSYDGLDRLTGITSNDKKKTLASNSYQYNAAGDITQNLDQGGTHVYGYDALDRLTSATYPATANESYAYDAVGNRTSSHRSATYTYQPFNRLTATSTATYLYDNIGNLTTKTESAGATHFAWDFENRLTQVVTPSAGSVTYKYDALGRRIQRAQSGSSAVSTNFIYDGQDVVRDLNSDGTTDDYLNGPGIDNKIRQTSTSGKKETPLYFLQDHLGSTIALTNKQGHVAEQITYDSYGNSTGSANTRYDFTGRERDSITRLMYYRARSYDSQTGRFVSEDPIRFGGGVNWYDYAGGSPVNWIDPFGWAKFLYWPAHGNSKFGHTALLLEDGTYISYWPTCYFGGKDPAPFKHCPPRPPSYDKDFEEEGSLEPDRIQLNGLDESAIKRWWSEGKGHGDFSLWNNCSDIVAEALRVGGLPIPRTTVYTTPDFIKQEIDRLLHDKEYPPPIPEPAPTPLKPGKPLCGCR